MPSSIYDIAIIGGGASGLAAAIVAAHEGARVLIIERDVEAGLPLLAWILHITCIPVSRLA